MKDIDAKKKLLLIDDELEFLDAAAKALERRGFFVVPAQDGATAFMLLRKQPFDVVVLDVKMPGIDGVEVFRNIKKLLPELPIILLTGFGRTEQAHQLLKEGAFDYLTKPCDVEELAEISREAASRH